MFKVELELSHEHLETLLEQSFVLGVANSNKYILENFHCVLSNCLIFLESHMVCHDFEQLTVFHVWGKSFAHESRDAFKDYESSSLADKGHSIQRCLFCSLASNLEIDSLFV